MYNLPTFSLPDIYLIRERFVSKRVFVRTGKSSFYPIHHQQRQRIARHQIHFVASLRQNLDLYARQRQKRRGRADLRKLRKLISIRFTRKIIFRDRRMRPIEFTNLRARCIERSVFTAQGQRVKNEVVECACMYFATYSTNVFRSRGIHIFNEI